MSDSRFYPPFAFTGPLRHLPTYSTRPSPRSYGATLNKCQRLQTSTDVHIRLKRTGERRGCGAVQKRPKVYRNRVLMDGQTHRPPALQPYSNVGIYSCNRSPSLASHAAVVLNSCLPCRELHFNIDVPFTMLCQLLLSLSAAASLAAAGILPVPDFDPAPLALRKDSCPTTSVHQSYHYTTVYRSTTTITNGVSSLGKVTSTKTESETRTINTISTVFSPSLVSSPSKCASPFVI